MLKSKERVIELKQVSSKIKEEKFLPVFFFGRFLPSRYKFFPALVICLLFIGFGNGAQAGTDIAPEKIIDLVNQSRVEKGGGILQKNDKLANAAEMKADDMIQNKYFSHNSPEGVTPWKWIEKSGYDYNYAGENLAMDFRSVGKMHQAWMNSPTHRANILNEKYVEIGVAVKEGIISGHETIVVVQMFGSGDKTSSEKRKEYFPEKKEMNLPETKETDDGQISFLNLPLRKERKQMIFPASPIITSPQTNEVSSSEYLEVMGISDAKKRVVILDNSEPIAFLAADDSGWFQARLERVKEGNHILQAISEENFLKNKSADNISARSVTVIIDRTDPEINYSLYAFSMPLDSSLIRIKSDEPGCVFEIDGNRIMAGRKTELMMAIPKNRLTANVRIEDAAGNSSRREINLTNFYQGSEKSSTIYDIASLFVPLRAVASGID